jgi:hypothetical protein
VSLNSSYSGFECRDQPKQALRPFGTIARVRSIASGFWPDRRRTNLDRARVLEPHRGATLALRSVRVSVLLAGPHPGRSRAESLSFVSICNRHHHPARSRSDISSLCNGHPSQFGDVRTQGDRCRSDLALIALSSSFVGAAGEMVSRAIVCILRSTFDMQMAIAWWKFSGDDQ